MHEYILAPDQDVVISSRVRLSRNYEDLPFSPKLTQEYAEEVIERTSEAVFHTENGSAFTLLRMSELEEDARSRLVEHHLISYDLLKFVNRSAAMVSSAGTVTIMLNEEDHVRLQVITRGLSPEQAYDTADKLDTLLDERLDFAFDEKLGYLTQCPTNLGTGMRASVMLHLPALEKSRAVTRIAGNLSKLGLTMRGAHGEGTEPKGALYQLSNQVTLGISEKAAIENLKNITAQLVAQEEQARERLCKSDEVRDAIARSLGILRYALVISHDEALKLLSNVRLGIVSGQITDISVDVIDRLMTDVEPATLTVNAGRSLSAHERDVARSELIRPRVAGAGSRN